MGEEDAQTVGCPFIIIIDPGDVFPLRQHNRLVTYRARPAVNVVVNVGDTRIVEGGDVLLQLFPGGGAIIHDDHLPVVVVLAQDRFYRPNRQLLAVPGRHID